MIAARLLQLRDRERALGMYSDVIAMVLSLEELRKLEGVSLAYVASVSVSFFARPRNFSLFGVARIGASTTNGKWEEGERRTPSRPSFRAAKKRKMRKALRKRLLRRLG